MATPVNTKGVYRDLGRKYLRFRRGERPREAHHVVASIRALGWGHLGDKK